MTRAPAPTTLRLRPLADASLAAIVTATGEVLAVMPRTDALALIHALVPCCTRAMRSTGAEAVSAYRQATVTRLPPRLDVAA